MLVDAIFERDAWVCQLCREPIDPSLSGQDPWGPTIDHIIPIALGGGHVPANLQAAHRRCNEAKGVDVVWRVSISAATLVDAMAAAGRADLLLPPALQPPGPA